MGLFILQQDSYGEPSYSIHLHMSRSSFTLHGTGNENWTGNRTGNDGFLYYATHYTETGNGTGNGNGDQWVPYPFPRSLSRSCLRSLAVWTSHNTWAWAQRMYVQFPGIYQQGLNICNPILVQCLLTWVTDLLSLWPHCLDFIVSVHLISLQVLGYLVII